MIIQEIAEKVENMKQEWKPIATAPKDGTEILLLIPISWLLQNRDERIGMGNVVQSGWFEDNTCIWRNRLDQWLNEHTPTHWMELPEETNGYVQKKG